MTEDNKTIKKRKNSEEFEFTPLNKAANTDEIGGNKSAAKGGLKPMSSDTHLTGFTGKYISALGKRKTSVARIRLYKNGKGVIIVNGKAINDYFCAPILRTIVAQPLKLTGHLKDFNFSILVKGGGVKGQADAARHGIARILEKIDEKLRPALKAKGWLTRDDRKKERKKPGLKKARRAPQWSKR